MRTRTHTSIALTSPLTIALLASAELLALPHGGNYRGPGCVAPPASSGSTASGPAAPSTPATAPTAPSTAPAASGGPAAPTARSSAVRANGGMPRGIQVGEDLSKWQFWWEFNKDHYLRLRETIHAPRKVLGSDEMFLGASRQVSGRVSARPTDKDVMDKILPAIHKALHEIHSRDVTSACLIALAKIGRDHKDFAILPLLRARLKSHDQEIRETAALAMGLSHLRSALPDLLALASDNGRGRELVQRSRVDARTRAFAVYGLGLQAHAHSLDAVHTPIVKTLTELLTDATAMERNVQIAAINAVGLHRFAATPAGQKLRQSALKTLATYFETHQKPGHAVIRAHIPPAVARLVGRGATPAAGVWMDRFAKMMATADRRSAELHRSAALAVGQMAMAAEKTKTHQRYSRALKTYARKGKDAQARYFSLIGLAQIGGTDNRKFLLQTLRTGSRTLIRPWAAIALGVFANRTAASGGSRDLEIAESIRKAFVSTSIPYARGAMAVALGLCGYRPAGGDLLEHLESHGHQDEMSGYLCIGLALMNFDGATPQISKLLDTSIRRPHRLRMAAVALGKLGDRRVSSRLLNQLAETDLNVAKMAAVAMALAQIGDRDSIAPLQKILADDKIPEIARAFAVVALGGIADKEAEPWNAKLATHANYRAAVETLVQSGAGVLDIL